MTPDPAPPLRRAPLPVLATARASYALVSEERMLLARMAVPWWLSLVMLSLLLAPSLRLARPSGEPTNAAMVTFVALVDLASLVVGLLAGIATAIAWHRFTLLGERPAFGAPLRPTARSYLLGSLALGGAAALIVLVMGFAVATLGSAMGGNAAPLATVGVLGSLPVMLYVVARLGPILPAIAVGETWRFDAIWRSTRGQGWRLAAILALTSLPVALIAELPVGSLTGPAGAIVMTALRDAVALVATALGAVALSIAYRQLGQRGEIRPVPASP